MLIRTPPFLNFKTECLTVAVQQKGAPCAGRGIDVRLHGLRSYRRLARIAALGALDLSLESQ